MSSSTTFTVTFLSATQKVWTHSRSFKSLRAAKDWALYLLAQPGVLDCEVHRCTKELISLAADADAKNDPAIEAEVLADLAASKAVADDLGGEG